MKILERNENEYVLEPLRQYLENEGIRAAVRREWRVGRTGGPYALIVDDADYEDAIKALDLIDKWEIDDGIPVVDEAGRSGEEIRHRYDAFGKIFIRIFLIVLIAAILFFMFR